MLEPTVDQLIIKLMTSGVTASEISSAGIDLNKAGSHGSTLLMAAASEGLHEAVEVLVDAGASVRAIGAGRVTALHDACASGHDRIALRLLELGADIDAETDDGVTPFLCAAAWGHIEVAKLFLAHGADSKHTDHTGASAVDIASEKGEQAFVDFLDSQENS